MIGIRFADHHFTFVPMSLSQTKKIDFLPAQARALMPYFILALAILAAYCDIFTNDFIYDDLATIQYNSYLHGWSHIGDILTNSTMGGAHVAGGFYRPLQGLFYLFAAHLGNGDTFWFHALNLALHIANACLVYKLGIRLDFDARGVFLAALIWSVHPLHTEAVTYMSGTADPLCAFFCLSAIIVLLPDFTPRKILKTIPLFLLGIAAKETMVMFPLLVVACLFYVSPQRFNPRTYFRTWPLWIIALVYAYWRLHAENFDGPLTYARFYELPAAAQLKAYAYSPLFRFLTFLATLPQYLQLLVWPTHLHMERNFSVYENFWVWPVVIGFMMTLFAAGCIVYSCLRSKDWLSMSWGFLWFAAAHAPDTGLLVPMNSLFLEHWMYLPSVGLFLGLAQTVVVLTRRLPQARPFICLMALVLACAFSIKTYEQNKIWHDPVSFYENIFASGESSARADNNLALYYSNHGQYDKAIDLCNREIAHADVYSGTRYTLALTYLRMSKDDESIAKAIENLHRALEIDPDFYLAFQLLGDIYGNLLHDKEKADFYNSRAEALINQLP
jgi:tetratricopeptide (TPR) repeat protein